MAFFTLKKIAALAGSQQIYLRGVSLYNAGKVRHVARQPNRVGDEYIEGRVDSSDGGSYQVEVNFGRDRRPETVACQCRAFEKYEGLCKHIVALLVHKYYADMVGGVTVLRPAAAKPSVRSDAGVRQLIEDHLKTAESAFRVEAAGRRPVTLRAQLNLYNRPPFLTFTVGRERQYILKDLRRFCENMAARTEVPYGSQFSLVHHEDAFEQASRPLLAFLLAACSAPERQNGRSAIRSGRELPLTPAMLDRYIELAAVSGGPEGWKLTDGNPELKLTVKEEAGRGGWSAALGQMGGSMQVLRGEQRLYVVIRDAIYRTDEEYARRMGGFLESFNDTGRLFAARRDMAGFAAVLAAAEPYVKLRGDTEKLTAFRPQKLTAALYLDMSEDSPLTVISGRLECVYGEGESAQTVYPFLREPAVERPAETPGQEPPSLERDRVEETRLRVYCERWFPHCRGDTGELTARLDEEALFDFLAEGLPALAGRMTVYTSDAFSRVSLRRPPAIAVGVSLSAGLLELEIDAGELPPEEWAALLASYRSRRRYHRLTGGGFVSLADEQLQTISRLMEGLSLDSRQLASRKATVPVYRALYIHQLLKDQPAVAFRQNEEFRELIREAGELPEDAFPVPESLEEIMRGYQKTGFRWLRTLRRCHFGGILADDMGLGKTLQMLSVILDVREREGPAVSLVVCPTSLVLNWQQEIWRFTPALSVLIVTGNAAERAEAVEKIGDYDVAVTSYDLLRRDIALYDRLRFRFHILDEAQYIKNHNTQNARAVKAVSSEWRFALTGTPIENRLSELWSIFDFLMPGFLYSYAYFREQFELPLKNALPAAEAFPLQKAETADQSEPLRRLNALVAPFILRRLKREVLKELPPKTETLFYTEMEEEQRRLYTANVLQMRQELDGVLNSRGEGQSKIQVLAMLMRLRQICCDPALCYENYTGGSAKLESCLELLREAIGGGHRVLVFSQFTSMLEILEKRLTKEKIPYYLLRGSTPKERRAELVSRFNAQDGLTPVFLISLKAGGTGLNLTGADVVIHYDPWWNYAAQNQATDRTHRIGQKRPVQVYKLIAKNTIEEKILRLQERKQQLADAVAREGDGILSAMNRQELLELFE
ncbi:MAG: DEAD/DEAH box helicase [Oscillospiraceae bacterium]|nr:DEAD/DEAH box helicase [Oscillospiraceae bacterium]